MALRDALVGVAILPIKVNLNPHHYETLGLVRLAGLKRRTKPLAR